MSDTSNPTHEIRSRWSAAVLFSGCFPSLREAVVAAAKAGANLTSADLTSADLTRANLYGANLTRANLTSANLYGANLTRANLYDADLTRADLTSADLTRANLYGANLYGANLTRANLYGANLTRANLYGANLYGAKNAEAAIAKTRILPEGAIVGWKKCRDGVLVKLLIPAEAKRSHAFGRKCRAEFAVVTEVIGADEGRSLTSYHAPVIYRPGETIRPEQGFSDNWQEECASGIHFFITREEAAEYSL